MLTPTALPSAEATTAAVEETAAVVEMAPTEHAGVIRGRPLRPPNLRVADMLEICTHIGVADVDDAIQRLVNRHHVPFSSDVLRRILYAIIAARRHTASRLLEHLAYLGSTTMSDSEILMAMLHHLQSVFEEGARS